MTLNECILLGAAVVMVYTMFGGMWSVALTDLFQTVVIIIGLILVPGWSATWPAARRR